MHNGNWNYGMGNGNWVPMMIMMVALWAGLIWVGITLLKRNNHATHVHAPGTPPLASPKPTAQEMLAERLARGDIDTDDYRQRLDALRNASES